MGLRLRYVIGGLLLVIAIALATHYVHIMRTPHASLTSLIANTSIHNIVPVFIIGAGPAGLSAGMYTARANFYTIVCSGPEEGGQLTHASYVENWPAKKKASGMDMMRDLKEQAESFGVSVLVDEVIACDFSQWPFVITLSDDTQVRAMSVIIATGGEQRVMDIPGVSEFWGKGIGICTICDAPFDKGKEVAVIGGGDAAADKALQLAEFAKKITIMVRAKEMRAAAVVQGYLKKQSAIEIKTNVEPLSIESTNGNLSGLKYKDLTTGKEEVLPVQSVYFALGFTPQSTLFKGQLPLTKEGYIKMKGRTQQTYIPGVFAAGNVEDDKYQKSGVAAGNGIKAAIDAIEFLQAIGLNAASTEKLKSRFYTDATQEDKVVFKELSSYEQLQNFIKQTKRGLVEVFAKACPICVTTKNYLEQVLPIYKEQLAVAQIAAEKVDQQQLPLVRMPTLLLIKEGKIVKQLNSKLTAEVIEKEVQELIGE
jgi:thioredoxin reductase (NADPH)